MGGNLRFGHVSAADNILGTLQANANEVQLAASSTANVPIAAGRFFYKHLRIATLANVPVGQTLQLGTLAVPGNLYLDAGAVFDLNSGSLTRVCGSLSLATTPTVATINNGGTLNLSQSAAALGTAVTSRILLGTTNFSTPCP